MIQKRILIVLFAYCFIPTKQDFVLLVNFTNYSNPSGLCAECNTTLESTPLDQIVPVCCDQEPRALTTANCANTGSESCDTRFRWVLRDFGDPIQTRPKRGYLYRSGSLATFAQPNPTDVYSRPFSPWRGKVQFYIEAVNSTPPNIIDSLLINLDNLQLGENFTEEMTFTGYHKISHMTMSFRVECDTNSYGPNCSNYCIDLFYESPSSCEIFNIQTTCITETQNNSGALVGVGLLTVISIVLGVIAVTMTVITVMVCIKWKERLDLAPRNIPKTKSIVYRKTGQLETNEQQGPSNISVNKNDAYRKTDQTSGQAVQGSVSQTNTTEDYETL